jgi:hypothetical protein
MPSLLYYLSPSPTNSHNYILITKFHSPMSLSHDPNFYYIPHTHYSSFFHEKPSIVHTLLLLFFIYLFWYSDFISILLFIFIYLIMNQLFNHEINTTQKRNIFKIHHFYIQLINKSIISVMKKSSDLSVPLFNSLTSMGKLE